MLSQYGPDLLIRCETALNLSKELVKTWLETYMFKDLPDREQKASCIASWLADHKTFKSHGRHLSRADLEAHGLKALPLEEDEGLQDLSLSVFHAIAHTFNGTPAVKIVENQNGGAFIKQFVPQQVQSFPIDIDPIPHPKV